MNFKKFIESTSPVYYRVYCKPMFGGTAINPIGPGTYWTPRWDSVVRMCNSIFLNFSLYQRKSSVGKDHWETTIFSLNDAEWADSPPEHKWAFSYNVDAGEQVLVKAYEEPKIIFKGFPDDEKFESIISKKIPVVIDHSKYKSSVITKDGMTLFLSPDYKNKEIVAYKKVGWQYMPVKHFKNKEELKKFLQQVELIQPFDQDGGLSYGEEDIWNNNKTNQTKITTRQRRSTRSPF